MHRWALCDHAEINSYLKYTEYSHKWRIELNNIEFQGQLEILKQLPNISKVLLPDETARTWNPERKGDVTIS